MKTTLFAGLVAATLTVSTAAHFVVADEAPAVKSPEAKIVAAQPVEEVPAGVIKGTVKTMRGLSLGFLPPRACYALL